MAGMTYSVIEIFTSEEARWHGSPLYEAIVQSCNLYFYHLGERVGMDRMGRRCPGDPCAGRGVRKRVTTDRVELPVSTEPADILVWAVMAAATDPGGAQVE